MPRETLRQVVAATYAQLWWPSRDEPVYVDTLPVWIDGAGYVDPDTGAVLPTWDEALDALDEKDAGPSHVLRFGKQLDMAGLLAGTADADRAVGHLCKYLTKSVTDTYDGEKLPAARARHLEHLHEYTRWLPCSPECAKWLRFGVQPKDAETGMTPGCCPSKAHAPDTLGLGGRRVLVSRHWTGKTLTDHKADRATIVRTVLEDAGYDAPNVDRYSATTLGSDGLPRYVWSPVLPEDGDTHQVTGGYPLGPSLTEHGDALRAAAGHSRRAGVVRVRLRQRHAVAPVELPATPLAARLGRNEARRSGSARSRITSAGRLHLPRGPTHALDLARADGILEVARRARLGHKMPGIARVYEHVTPEMEAQIADALEARWVASLRELTDAERAKLLGWLPALAHCADGPDDRPSGAIGGATVSQISPTG
ncbi:MAG: replication initiator [Nocardioidaceae bacterium]